MRRSIPVLVLSSLVVISAGGRVNAANKPAAELQVPADRLVKLDTSEAFKNATMTDVKLVESADQSPRLVLNDPKVSNYPREGTWTSNEYQADFPFTQLIASWNAHTTDQSGIRFFVRVRDAKSHDWSPWLYTGYWGNPSPIDRVITFDGGRIDEDTLKLKQPADAWQIKAKLQSFTTDVEINPMIRRISVVYSGKTSPEQAKIEARKSGIPPLGDNWAVDLPVPFRPQGDNPGVTAGETCSPTSVSMVMAYWGVDRPTVENMEAIWDRDNDMFGNWNRAVALPGSLGLDAWVTRFRNLDEVKAVLATGQPIVASIRFKRGQFPSGIFPATAGHLIVLRGFTPEGDVICNDPASRKYGDNVVYKAADIVRVWIDHGGVGYIIKGTHPVGPPVASHAPHSQHMKTRHVMGE